MAVRRLADEQPASFQFTPDNDAWAKAKIEDYPEGRQASAVIPILWKAQEQHNGWLPEPAIRLVADMLKMPYIRVLEVATFYTMFQLKPVGSVAHIGVCGTTPCMLRGSEELIDICKRRIASRPFELSADGRFSWEEVECAGACVNAPMIQIGAETYEDLTAESFGKILDTLEEGGTPTVGPQSARRSSEPVSGATSLKNIEEKAEGEAVGSEPGADADVDPATPAAKEEFAGYPDSSGRPETEAARSGGGSQDEASAGAAAEKPADDDAPQGHDAETDGLMRSEAVDVDEEPETQKSEPARSTASDAPASGETYTAAETATSAQSTETDDTATSAKSAETEETATQTAEGDGTAASSQSGGTDEATASPEPAEAEETPPSGEGDQTPVRQEETEASAPAPSAAQPDAPDRDAASRADGVGTRPRARNRSDGKVDNLRRIAGIGPVIKKTLNDLGIFTFEQIAEWDDANKAWVNSYLAFKGRIDRERWVEQAREIVENARDES